MYQPPMFSNPIGYENFNQQSYFDVDWCRTRHFYRGRFAYVFNFIFIFIYDTWTHRKYWFVGKFPFIFLSTRVIELNENKLLVLCSDSEDVHAQQVTLNFSNRSYETRFRSLNLYPQRQYNKIHFITKTNVQNTILIDVCPNGFNTHSVFLYNYETNVNQRLITYEENLLTNRHFDENTQRFYIVNFLEKESRRFESMLTETGIMLRALETVRLSTGFETSSLQRSNECFERNLLYVLYGYDKPYIANSPTCYLHQLVKIWNLDDGTCRAFKWNPFVSTLPRMSITDGFLHIHYDLTSYWRKSQTRRYPIKRPETLFMLAWFARPKNSVMPRAIIRKLDTNFDVASRINVNDLKTYYNTVIDKYQNGEFGVILTFVLFIVHHFVTFVVG